MVPCAGMAAARVIGSRAASRPSGRAWRRFGSITSVIGAGVLASMLLGLATARAAPYCLVGFGLPPQCIYADVALCRREALKTTNSVCSVNTAEVRLPTTPAGRFCLVVNGPVVQCMYPDRRTCDAEAALRSGICSDTQVGRPDVDIFRQ
jgi:hypothetical protein